MRTVVLQAIGLGLLTAPLAPAQPVKEQASFKASNSLVVTVAFDREGKVLASGASDGTVRLWNIASRQEQAGC